MTAAGITTDPGPRAESALFSRYLLGVNAPPHLSERYDAACARLFPEPPAPADAALLSFARRHPWSIAPLDAAAALIRPGSLLRRKILVMAAILETTPDHADRFLPKARPVPALLLTIVWVGITSVVYAAIGLPLIYLAQRARV